MNLYEKIKTMTMEEMACELMLVATWDKNQVSKLLKTEDGLLDFITEVLSQDLPEEEDFNVYDIATTENICNGNTITISYDIGEVEDGEYSLAFTERKYNESTDTFNRSILAFSNGTDTQENKSNLIRILHNIAEQAIVVD